MGYIKTLTAAAIAAMPIVFAVGAAMPAAAQSGMTCEQLWYERNAIYAAKGFCFKTQRARNVFGRACFPPYGKLTPAEQRRVNNIEQWEVYQGCR
jgi:hypothetical protein